MWKIDENLKITLTRGDTPSFKLNLTSVNEQGEVIPYVPSESDVIMFAMKKSANSQDLWAYKEIPHDTMTLVFTQEMTRGVPFGEYVYEISLNTESGYHDTFIANKPISITEELYDG